MESSSTKVYINLSNSAYDVIINGASNINTVYNTGLPIWYDLPNQKRLTPYKSSWNSPSAFVMFGGYPLPKHKKLAYYSIVEEDENGVSVERNVYTDIISTIFPGCDRYYSDLFVTGSDYELVEANPYARFTCITYDINENTQTYTKEIGDEFEVSAATAPTGYEFYKWDGDIQYIPDTYQGNPQDRFSPTLGLVMPDDNMVLYMRYKLQGTVILSHVLLHSGKIRLGDDPSSYTYVTEGEFPEDTVLTIVADPIIQEHWMFSKWGGEPDSLATVADIFATETTITVPDYDVELTREVMERAQYTLALTNGEVAGTYYTGDLVSVYYSPPNGNPHYVFSRWTGDTSKVTLQGGGAFDPTYAGTPNSPQVIVMPDENISLTAEYTVTLYTLTVANGMGSGRFVEGDAMPIQGTIDVPYLTFSHWEGGTSYIVNPLAEQTSIIMPGENITVRAVYASTLPDNDSGYVTSDLSSQSTVNRDAITILSGTIQTGFIITDSVGYMYIVTGVSGDTISIQSLTS